MLAAQIVVADAASINDPAPVLTKEQRIARNHELARKFYDGYVRMPEVGYPETFNAQDWEKGATVYVFDRSEKAEYIDRKRKWRIAYRVDEPQDWKEFNKDEYSTILKILPDWKIVTPFKAFCNEEGCAWQMFAGGHDKDGNYFECDEIEFMWTNERGKIERVEVFNDWVNMAAFLGRIAGIPPEQVDYVSYGDALKKAAAESSKSQPEKSP